MSSKEQQAQMAMERMRFAQAASTGTINPSDRFGAPIQGGINALYRPEVDIVYSVLEVKPVLDPKMPPGLMQIRLAADFILTVPAGQPISRMIAIGTVAPPAQQPAREEAPVEAAPSEEAIHGEALIVP